MPGFFSRPCINFAHHFANVRKYTTLQCKNVDYLEHGGCTYVRENDVTVIPCIVFNLCPSQCCYLWQQYIARNTAHKRAVVSCVLSDAVLLVIFC